MTKRRALAFLLLFCMFALGFLLLAFDAFGKEPRLKFTGFPSLCAGALGTVGNPSGRAPIRPPAK